MRHSTEYVIPGGFQSLWIKWLYICEIKWYSILELLDYYYNNYLHFACFMLTVLVKQLSSVRPLFRILEVVAAYESFDCITQTERYQLYATTR